VEIRFAVAARASSWTNAQFDCHIELGRETGRKPLPSRGVEQNRYMNKWKISASVAALAILAAGVALLIGLSHRVSDAGNCADAIALINNDPGRAVAVCRRQANEGDAVAQTDIGRLYAEGRGVAQDFSEAQRWFHMAADQGQPDALYDLGMMYANGQGGPPDYVEAVKWYRLAAERGQPDAQNSLGVRYKRGEGVGQDYVQAYKWFALSEAGTTRAADRARATANRDAVALLMTPRQIADAQALAAAWRPTTGQ
jgi:TPR repeat protein